MKKVEFYISNKDPEYRLGEMEESLVRTEYYHDPVKAAADCNRWMNISKSYHYKVYEKVDGSLDNWQQAEEIIRKES